MFKKTLLKSGTARFIKQYSTTRFGGMPKQLFQQIVENLSPYIREVLTVKIQTIENSQLILTMAPKMIHTDDFLHNGLIASLIDHCGGFCAWTALTSTNQKLSTVDLHVSYLRPCPWNELLICDSKVVQLGNKLIRVDINCWNSDRSIQYAAGRGLFNVYTGKISTNNFLNRLLQKASVDIPLWMVKGLQKIHEGMMIHRKYHGVSSGTRQSYELQTKSLDNEQSFAGMTSVKFRELFEQGSRIGREVLGIKLEILNKGKLTSFLTPAPYLTGNTMAPCLHGGVLAALIDHTGQFCALSSLPGGQNVKLHDTTAGTEKSVDHWTCTSLENRIDYLSPAPCFEEIVCDAVVIQNLSTDSASPPDIARNSTNDTPPGHTFNHHLKDGIGGIIAVDMVCWNAARSKKVALGRGLYRLDRVQR